MKLVYRTASPAKFCDKHFTAGMKGECYDNDGDGVGAIYD
jgi:hypothetical protein